MGDKSLIEWTDATWPIVQGCDPVSQGCVHCYAIKLLWRMMHNPDPKISGPLQGLVEKHVNADGEEILRFTGKLALREDRLTWPLQWKRPRMIFVPSHGDLFHKGVPDEFILKTFDVMRQCSYAGGAEREHTFQVLTKRADRMLQFARRLRFDENANDVAGECALYLADDDRPPIVLKNTWLGVSAERQQEADERREPLRALAVQGWLTFVSYEPALGPVDWSGWEFLKWMISGGESGSKARPSHPDWHRTTRDWCGRNGIAYLFKQWGEFGPSISGLALAPDGTSPPSSRWSDPSTAWMARVGKKAAGRLLDGKTYDGFPEVRA